MRIAKHRRLIANFLGFQASWIACVGGAAVSQPAIGPLVAVLWLSLHVASLKAGRRDANETLAERAVELRLLMASGAVGYLLDSLLAVGGALAFPDHAGPAWPTTPWMIALWVGFAGTLRHSMNWARRRYAIGAVAGAVFGPLAYRAGEALGAIALAAAPLGLLAVAVEWAVAMPLLLWLRERAESGMRKLV